MGHNRFYILNAIKERIDATAIIEFIKYQCYLLHLHLYIYYTYVLFFSFLLYVDFNFNLIR